MLRPRLFLAEPLRLPVGLLQDFPGPGGISFPLLQSHAVLEGNQLLNHIQDLGQLHMIVRQDLVSHAAVLLQQARKDVLRPYVPLFQAAGKFGRVVQCLPRLVCKL